MPRRLLGGLQGAVLGAVEPTTRPLVLGREHGETSCDHQETRAGQHEQRGAQHKQRNTDHGDHAASQVSDNHLTRLARQVFGQPAVKAADRISKWVAVTVVVVPVLTTMKPEFQPPRGRSFETVFVA